MESVTELKQQDGEASAERERSTIAFPYSDLDAAVEMVRGVHHAGGTACDYDQLAAELKMEAKGGGFRLRIGGAQTFGVVTNERGRITLTDLGRLLADPQQERSARVTAFLNVPLYQRVYEQFKGGPLPPQAGLERAIEAMGVGAKVKEKARQVLLRSAKQAGFFEAASDRLVKPSIRQEFTAERLAEQPDKQVLPPGRSTGVGAGGGVGGGAAGGGSGGGQHPLIQGLLLTLQEPGKDWSSQERVNWLNMAASIFKMIYTEPTPSDIEIKIKGGSAAAG